MNHILKSSKNLEKIMSTRSNNLLRVSDVALGLSSFPVLRPTDLLKTALEEMTSKRLGIVCVVDGNNILLGIFTDGDIRRHLLKVHKPFSAFFSDDIIDHAQLKPTIIRDSCSLKEALNLMAKQQVWDLPVVSEDNKLIGLLHLHPLVQHLMNCN